MTDFKRLPASDVGLRAPRSCTNLCGVVFFIAFWALMIFIGITSYKLGDLDRLIYGVDYMGNICGKGTPDLVNLNGVPWSSRTTLWYPVTFDVATNSFQIAEARKMGICVDVCPNASTTSGSFDVVHIYYAPGGSPPNAYGLYVSLFKSNPKFNRCVPDLKSFFCENVADCQNQTNFVTANIGELYDGLTDGFNSLQAGWWILLVCAIIAIVVCFAWMFVLRRLVKPMVVATMTILVVVLAVGGYILYHMSKDGGSSSDYYLGGAIAAWVVDFLVICVILFVRKDVMIACDIIEEAAKIPTSIPTMMLVPPVAALAMLPFTFFFLFTSATIYTAANTVNVTASVPSFAQSDHSFLGYNTTETKQFAVENWRIYAEVYNLLMFLWSVGFVNAIAYMIVAFCAIFWYWSNPGDDKKPEAGTCAAAGLTLKNHLGTLIIGSCIVAVLQVARIVLSILEKRLQTYAGKSDAVKCCLYCAECMLACFHRIVKFINKNAYIMTAMTGEPFLDAARHALHLLLGNALSVAAISVIGEWICLFGKVLITSVVLVICYFMAGGADSDKNVVLLMVVVGLATYFITCVFINVFHVCIDAVLLSYCYDLQEHDGQSKPYYFPSDLAKHVSRARDRMKAKELETRTEGETPLNKQV